MGLPEVNSPQLLSEARPEDLQRAQDYLREGQFNDDVIAVFRVSEKNSQNATNSAFAVCFFCPCAWPYAIICSPCLCMAHTGMLAILRGTIFVLGRKNFYRIVDAEIGPCGGCAFQTGRDSGYVALKDVVSVAVNSRGGGAMACFPTESVIVGLPLGCPLAESNGKEVSAVMNLLVEDPDQASMLIRQAKEAADAAQQQAIPQMVMGRITAGDPGEDILIKMQNLKNMRDQGLITESEFAIKRQEILATM